MASPKLLPFTPSPTTPSPPQLFARAPHTAFFSSFRLPPPIGRLASLEPFVWGKQRDTKGAAHSSQQGCCLARPFWPAGGGLGGCWQPFCSLNNHDDASRTSLLILTPAPPLSPFFRTRATLGPSDYCPFHPPSPHSLHQQQQVQQALRPPSRKRSGRPRTSYSLCMYLYMQHPPFSPPALS